VSGAVCDNNIVLRYLGTNFGPFPDVVYEVNAFIADTEYIDPTTKTNTLYTNRQENNTVYSMWACSSCMGLWMLIGLCRWIGTNDLAAGGFLTEYVQFAFNFGTFSREPRSWGMSLEQQIKIPAPGLQR
jgi:hypothetical protein